MTFPSYWVMPTPGYEMRHHLKIWKPPWGHPLHDARFGWRVDCPCGEWQVAERASDLWKYLSHFRHIKRGWENER
jgi:hypothetical protein